VVVRETFSIIGARSSTIRDIFYNRRARPTLVPEVQLAGDLMGEAAAQAIQMPFQRVVLAGRFRPFDNPLDTVSYEPYQSRTMRFTSFTGAYELLQIMSKMTIG
jgi:hypothetical protein